MFSETEQGELSPTSAPEMSVLQAVIPHSRSDVWAPYPSIAASLHRALGHLGLDNHQCKMLPSSKISRGNSHLKEHCVTEYLFTAKGLLCSENQSGSWVLFTV